MITHEVQSADQELIDKFVRELSEAVADKFAEQVDFIILFGSAARSEFIRGVSDIDLVIQLFDDASVAGVEQFAAETFWRLNQKYQTGFEVACATKKSATLLDTILSKLEVSANLYTPIFVFGPDDLDWEKGVVKKKSLLLGANLIVSQSTIFYKFKTEGKIYYGRDIRLVIHPKFIWWEKWKALLIPQYLSIFGMFISLILPKRAVKYCNKAILWEIDSALVYIADFRKLSRPEKIHSLERASEISLDPNRVMNFMRLNINVSVRIVEPKDFKIVDRALHYKTNGFHGRRFEALRYSLSCLWFIVRLNTSVVSRNIVTRTAL